MVNRIVPIRWLLTIIIGVALVVVFYDDFGTAWDDGKQAIYGDLCLDYYLSGGNDLSFSEYHNMSDYGSLFEIFSAMIHRWISPDDIFTYRNLLVGLCSLATVCLTMKLGDMWGSRLAGTFAGLFLATSPQFWGQAFINSKDVPFALAYTTWWMAYSKWYGDGFRCNRYMVISAVSAGFVLAIRISGLPLLGFTVLAGMTGWIVAKRHLDFTLEKAVRSFPFGLHALVLALAWLLMIPTWPNAIENPLWNPVVSFMSFLEFSWRAPVLLIGDIYMSDILPRFAFALEHFLSHPLWCYPFYAAGIIALAHQWRSVPPGKRYPVIAIGFWTISMFLLFLVRPFNMYNGVRQTLFLWPTFAILAGMGAHAILVHLKTQGRSFYAYFGGGFAIFANVVILFFVHPFSYTYRNELVYLLPGGVNGFDGDYHALSYKLAAEYMNAVANERQSTGREPPSVIVLVDPLQTHYSFSRYAARVLNVHYTTSIMEECFLDAFEFVVILHPYNRQEGFISRFNLDERKEIKSISRMGKQFAHIYQSDTPVFR